jgi:hypothetical protein
MKMKFIKPFENFETVNESNFTVEDGIKIQSEQLAQWKKLLLPKVYKDLEKWATEHNDKAKSGNDIIRGTDMDNFIGNYFNSYTPSNKR